MGRKSLRAAGRGPPGDPSRQPNPRSLLSPNAHSTESEMFGRRCFNRSFVILEGSQMQFAWASKYTVLMVTAIVWARPRALQPPISPLGFSSVVETPCELQRRSCRSLNKHALIRSQSS